MDLNAQNYSKLTRLNSNKERTLHDGAYSLSNRLELVLKHP
jgi:hypothetical protein